MDREQRKKYAERLKKGILAECVLVVALAALVLGRNGEIGTEKSLSNQVLAIEGDYIKWVDFTVSYEALCKAYEWDVETHGSEHEINWVELLAYTAAKTGGEFDSAALKTMEKAAEKLSGGESTMEELTEDLKYYSYYKEAYDAAIGGLVGEYWEEVPEAAGSGQTDRTENNEVNRTESDNTAGTENGGTTPSDSSVPAEEAGNEPAPGESGQYVQRYGLKGYFPLARGFDYTHYDDFGVSRSYGYERKHLG